jgi:flagellar assembly protein FliH
MMAENAQSVGSEMRADVEVFDYPSVPGEPMPLWEAFPSIAMNHSTGTSLERSDEEAPAVQEAVREMHAEALRQSFDAGVARGVEEGRAAERQSFAATAKAQEMRRIEQAARLVEEFNRQYAQFLQGAEREVVKLALAVAARILRREAEMDPLLLSGAVRVALGQLSASTKVQLRVPADDLELWRDTIAHLPNLNVKPAVVAGDGMSLGECVLDSELGSADLGLGSQMKEIESALFDGTGTAREHPTRMGAMKVGEEMAE